MLGKWRIEEFDPESGGVKGSPRTCDDLRYDGEACGQNRVARLKQEAGLQGIPQRRRWGKKSAGQ